MIPSNAGASCGGVGRDYVPNIQEIQRQCLTLMETPNGQRKAVELATRTTEELFKLATSCTDASTKRTYLEQIQRLLVFAEKLKKFDGGGVPTPRSRTPIRQIDVSERTTSEKIVLLKSTKVGLHKFHEWTTNPTLSDFQGKERYSDPAGLLHLSPEQEKILEEWRRPDEVWGVGNVDFNPQYPIDLVQEAVPNCSIVSSMCAALNREGRGHGRILSCNIFPQDANGAPVESPIGKYIVRLYFNGCFRKVEIDDRLPCTGPEDDFLHVSCQINHNLVWPALIEKAYLKVMGGYDFPGSNCGMDLLALTGWIPEHIFLETDSIDQDFLWKRMFKSWTRGDVLLTLGTGKIPHNEAADLGLVAEHDYAVLGLKEVKGRRLVLVKNPWRNGIEWRGSSFDSEDEDYIGSEGSENDFDAPIERTPEELEMTHASEAEGTFWIEFQDVVNHFRSLYLNWNPDMFPHRRDVHFSWDLSKSPSSLYSFRNHPQYCLRNIQSDRDQPVWLLLQRHISGCEDGLTVKRGHISLYVYDAEGQRVFASNKRAIIKGHYVDSNHMLLRLESLPANAVYTVVVMAEGLEEREQLFTLSVLSLYAIRLDQPSNKFTHVQTIGGEWTAETAGGTAQSPSFSDNPQFSLELGEKEVREGFVDIMVFLECRHEYGIQVQMAWGEGKRVPNVTTRDIFASSGEYRRGCAFFDAKDVQYPNKFTLIASTFEPGQLGRFTLTVMSKVPIQMSAIPSETAGKLVKRISGKWHSSSRILRTLHVARLARVSTILKAAGITYSSVPPLRVSLEVKKPGSFVAPEVMVSSQDGDFAGIIQGVRTKEVYLERGWDVFVVVERVGRLPDDEFELTILSDTPVSIGAEIRDD